MKITCYNSNATIIVLLLWKFPGVMWIHEGFPALEEHQRTDVILCIMWIHEGFHALEEHQRTDVILCIMWIHQGFHALEEHQRTDVILCIMWIHQGFHALEEHQRTDVILCIMWIHQVFPALEEHQRTDVILCLMWINEGFNALKEHQSTDVILCIMWIHEGFNTMKNTTHRFNPPHNWSFNLDQQTTSLLIHYWRKNIAPFLWLFLCKLILTLSKSKKMCITETFETSIAFNANPHCQFLHLIGFPKQSSIATGDIASHENEHCTRKTPAMYTKHQQCIQKQKRTYRISHWISEAIIDSL